MEFDERGREIPDARPVEWPVGLSRPLSIQEEIQRFVRVEMSKRAEDHGFETFEEADDFDVPDEDGELVSPYEMTELQEERGFTPAEPPLTSAPDIPQSVPNKTNADNAGSVSTTPDDAVSGAKQPSTVGPT